MSAIYVCNDLIIPIAVVGAVIIAKNLSSTVEDEITYASMDKLVSLSKSYQENMQFWHDLEPLALVATLASIVAAGFTFTMGLNHSTSQVMARNWNIILAGSGVLFSASVCGVGIAKINFENYQYLYDRCIQKLKIEFNYNSGV